MLSFHSLNEDRNGGTSPSHPSAVTGLGVEGNPIPVVLFVGTKELSTSSTAELGVSILFKKIPEILELFLPLLCESFLYASRQQIKTAVLPTNNAAMEPVGGIHWGERIF